MTATASPQTASATAGARPDGSAPATAWWALAPDEALAQEGSDAAKGLTVVSVSVDQPQDPTSKAAALAFLTKQRAAFRNVILSDAAEVWQEKWKKSRIQLQQ